MILHFGVIRCPRQELENQPSADLAARPCASINGFEIEKRSRAESSQGDVFLKNAGHFRRFNV